MIFFYPNMLINILSLFFIASCSSYQQFEHITKAFELPSHIFRSNYDDTWKFLQIIMKHYDMEPSSLKLGLMKTKWQDNTIELNFTDAFDKRDQVKFAKFKIIVNVMKIYRDSREMTKVSILKKQMVNTDFLQGWKILPSDGILEKTLLYRLGREIDIEKRKKKIEILHNKRIEENF